MGGPDVFDSKGLMKLDTEKANAIRERLKTGISQTRVAKEFGVCQMTVSKIYRGIAYTEDRISERDRFLSYVDKTIGYGPWGDCWEWKAGKSPRGYGHFKLDRRNSLVPSKTVRANRYVWESTFGPISDGLIIRHICDNPGCCRVGHLVLGTQADNLRDARLKGRRPSREV